uniref:rab GTPase-activating protein 22-like n=1 Tax=Erigeron canadensis TaxID=72917 RepID=UPI001CB91AA0|nr:rab GTPase-activating protein 22-like [Erigeron canadensis]XP_043610309.1 rab GTPase-activating protein 22-like [Erigeron canadensis]
MLRIISSNFHSNSSKSENGDMESFFPVRPECREHVPNTRFKPKVGKTLSERRWNAAFDKDGRLDIAGVLRRIQRGGIHPSIKGAVWEFLLGCYDPNSTSEERDQLRQKRREQYASWKEQCKKIVPIVGSGKFVMTPLVNEDEEPVEDNVIVDTKSVDDSDEKVTRWKLSLHQIGLDVVRTDRSLVFYENEANQAKLWDVLAIYTWVDDDIGYVQGMNDICSPMVILLKDEADAFWCFEHAMRRVRENFRSDATSMGVQSQLGILSQVMRVVDPKLHKHLEGLDGGEYLFAIRMLMVLFRREFSFIDALYLWEVMWAMEYNPNMFADYASNGSHEVVTTKLSKKVLQQYGKYERKNVKKGRTDQKSLLAVFLVAGVLETKNKKLLNEAKGLDDVAQIMGDITGSLDAKKALTEALRIHKKYLSKARNR